MEPNWLGANTPHLIRCPLGHESSPQPTHVQQGEGICRLCAGKQWDAFYVVVNEGEGVVKFGITSGSLRPRLKRHARYGYKKVLRALPGLPAGVARLMERHVIVTLRAAGEMPVKGVEYYDMRVTTLVLNLVDSYSLRPLQSRSDDGQLAFDFEIAG